jgi:hypothetical protein
VLLGAIKKECGMSKKTIFLVVIMLIVAHKIYAAEKAEGLPLAENKAYAYAYAQVQALIDDYAASLEREQKSFALQADVMQTTSRNLIARGCVNLNAVPEDTKVFLQQALDTVTRVGVQLVQVCETLSTMRGTLIAAAAALDLGAKDPEE